MFQACYIGKSRTYSKENESEIDLNRSEYIAQRCKASMAKNKDNLAESASEHPQEGSAAKKIKIDNDEKEPTKGWAAEFQVRSSEEKPRNCVSVDSKVKDTIISLVFRAVLDSKQGSVLDLGDGRRWNKGG